MKVFSIIAAVLAVLVVTSPNTAVADIMRPTDTVVLADFETADSVALWSGLGCTQTDAQASSGAHGLSFAIPKYVKGDEERPRVVLRYDGGKGFPFQDFSRYAAIEVDVWVAGDQPGKMGLKLRDDQAHDSWTTHATIEPGKVNHVVLPVDEAKADMDITHVNEIVLYGLRPETAYTLIVDKLRLTPRAKPPVAAFDLIYPNYRNLIFPEGGDLEIRGNLALDEYGIEPRQVKLVLTVEAGGRERTLRRTVREGSVTMTVPAKGLPAGPVTLKAALVRKRDQIALARREWTMRKLTPEEVGGLKVYLDRSGATIANGKPFFPLGWYTSTDEKLLDEIADSPFNCVLAYGTDHLAKEQMLHYLDRVQEKGLKIVYCMNDVYPTATNLDATGWEGIKGNEAIADAVVAAYREHPAVVAWYLNDELPHKLVPQLTDYYQRVANNDPNHPCFIVLCNRSELQYFPDTTDIMGVDPYPLPKGPVTDVNTFVDMARDAARGTKPVWLVPQAFAWYQYSDPAKSRGRIPTEDELKTGRAPTYEEERCMTYLGLTHGAKALIYYCYYDLRVLPQYAEMWGWMKQIAQEVKDLAPVLLAPDDLGPARVSPGEAPVHTLLKRCDGRLYLIAVNAGREPCRTTFQLGHRLPRTVEERFTHQKVATQGAKLTLEFKPLEAQVYELGPSRK